MLSIVRAAGCEAEPRRMARRVLRHLRDVVPFRSWTLRLSGEDGRGPGRSAAAAIPLVSRGRTLGTLVLRPLHGRALRKADRLRAALLLEPLAVALDAAILLRHARELSVTDDLTHLYNGRYQNAALRRELARARRYRLPVSFIFLDLDGFKSVNDRHGHLMGSRALVEVGAVLRAVVREIDVVARFGGDEFTVILPQTGAPGARVIAERLRQRIASTRFLAAYGLNVRLTASFGIASYPEHGRTAEELVARSDQAMYQAKDAGRNRVAAARPSPVPQAL